MAAAVTHNLFIWKGFYLAYLQSSSIFVINKQLKVTGIVTLENVHEEIVEEIVDEYDALRDAGLHMKKKDRHILKQHKHQLTAK